MGRRTKYKRWMAGASPAPPGLAGPEPAGAAPSDDAPGASPWTWERRHHHSPWHARGLHRKRRYIFLRLAGFFGVVAFLFMLTLAVGWFLNRVSGGGLPHPQPGTWSPLVFLGLCAIPFFFVFLFAVITGLTFRRIGWPVAEVMAAAEAVAEGDLSVRVNENHPGEFGQMLRSFNRMTAELSRAEQQRRNLTADVAHELRTPLHIVQGNLEGLLDGVYQPTPEHLEATLDEVRLLSRLVNDLQTLSLAEAGQLPLHPQTFLASDLLADVLASFSGPAAEAGVTLEIDPGAGALELEADPDRLDQVLSNLVANALRHTPPGGRISLAAGQGQDWVEIRVADTGAGIAAEDLPYIFDRFWRGDRARQRSGGGSGLGLAIARQLVQSHGGAIAVASAPGQGTVFTIRLPGAGAQAAED